MNVLGKVYIYRETHLNNQLNGNSALDHNKIFGLQFNENTPDWVKSIPLLPPTKPILSSGSNT